MSKLVDRERLAKLAKALDDRAKAAVKAEADRAAAAEQRIEGKADANAEAIAAINNVETGILKQAKAYADGKDAAIGAKVEQSAYDAKMLLLDQKDDDQQEEINELAGKVATLEGKMGDKDMAGIQGAINDFKAEQQGVDAAQDAKIADLEARVKGREAAEGVEAVVGLEKEMDNAEARLDALEALFEGEDSVDAKIAEVHGEVVALESKHDQAAQAQAEKDQAQDEAIAAKVAKADYEVDKKALQDEDARLDQAIKDEAARADAAEKANKALIDAINNADNGILAQAKAHAQGLVDGEKDAREDADAALDDRLKVVEAAIADGGALESRVQANEDKLAGLEEGCNTVQAAIDKAEADAKAHAEQKITDLVDSAPEAMNTLKELADAIKDNKDVYDGYVAEHAQAMAKQKEDLQKEIDDDIAAAVGVKAAEGVEATGLRKEIADAVKVEADRAKAEEADIRADFAAEDKKLADQIKAVEEMLGVDSGDGEVGAFAQIQADIEALQGVVGNAEDGLVKDVADLKAEDQRLAGEIAAKVAQADYDAKVQELGNADAALGNRIAVFEAGGAQDVAAKEVRLAAAEQAIVDLEAFEAGHSHDQMIADIAANTKAIADNRKACQDEMAQEVLDRNQAIADALEAYSTTEEVKAILGNVVATLNLSMADNKVVLKLGGAEGIALSEVSLDLATDDDIDAIIAGLDAE